MEIFLEEVRMPVEAYETYAVKLARAAPYPRLKPATSVLEVIAEYHTKTKQADPKTSSI